MVTITGKDQLNKSYQLIYKHGNFSEIKPSIDFYVDDKEDNINITSHLENNLWIIKGWFQFLKGKNEWGGYEKTRYQKILI